MSDAEDWQEPRTAVERWEQAAAPFHWMPGTHVRHFPHGVEFESVQAEPRTWHSLGSVADVLGSIRHEPPEGLLWTLGRNGQRVGKPWRLRGPFHLLYDAGEILSLTAHGGVIERQEPQVLVAQSIRVTPLDAEGKPTGPSRMIQGVADVIVSFTPVLEEAAVVLGHLARATMTATAQLKGFAYSRVLNAFYVADRVLTWTRDGRRLWVHRSWVRPMPVLGLTRRQKRAQRRIRRRKTR